MTTNCPHCGGEIADGAKKCKHCGKWLEAKSSLNILPLLLNVFGAIILVGGLYTAMPDLIKHFDRLFSDNFDGMAIKLDLVITLFSISLSLIMFALARILNQQK